VIVVIDGRIDREDVPKLCARVVEALEDNETDPIVCDVRGVGDPDAVMVDALARVQLTARRLGRRVRLRHACVELLDMLGWMGLADAVGGGRLHLELRRQVEQREPPCRVEEERDTGDPAARDLQDL
jgi:ABC-type transporter Mla MlaB component